MADSERMTDGGGEGDVPSSGSALPFFLATRLVILALIVGLLYLTRPLWHGLMYAAVYSPSGLLVIGGGALAAVVLWFVPPSKFVSDDAGGREPTIDLDGNEHPFDDLVPQTTSAGQKLRILVVIVGVLFVLGIIVGIPAGALEQRTLAQETMSDATEVDEFPQANPDNPRVVPQEVSDVSTRGAVSYRQHRLGTSDIARQEDGSLAWSYPIQPDGFRNMLFEHQRGVMVANMTSMDDRQTEAYETEFEYGEGMLFHRSADWNLKTSDYFARYDDDPVEFSHDGEPYLYYAKTVHEWRFTPFPHTVPTWEGGALVHTDGTIEHLSPAEARDHEVLEGQRLYPITLALAEMQSLGHREGIINQLPVVGAHKGEIEIARLPAEADNEQPFVIDLEGESMSYVTAMEPYGFDTRGLDEVWFADARTGNYDYYGTEAATLIGPERAMGIARSADSRTNWGQNFVVTEPVPVTIDSDLWWHIKVSPTDFTDVTRNVFVNADTGAAVEIRDDAEIRDFIRGDVTEDDLGVVADGPEDETDGGDVAYYIIVTNEDGEVVERIPVRSGQDTTIVDPEDERVSEDETGG